MFDITELLSPFAIERLRASLLDGDAWLSAAPSRLEDEAIRLGFEPTVIQWGGNRSVACRALSRDGVEVVVKLAAYAGSTRREVLSLAALVESRRVPEILACDEKREVLVTRAIQTAIPLSDLDEDKLETASVADLLSRVHSCDTSLLPSEHPVAFRLAAAWQTAEGWRNAPRMELCRAAEVLELLPTDKECALHGDLVPANVLKDENGVLWLVDPQAAAGDPASSAASWGLLRGNGPEQGWRTGGGAIRRALLVGQLLGCNQQRVLAYLTFQAFEMACRQASWEQWEWAAESIELARAAREASE